MADNSAQYEPMAAKALEDARQHTEMLRLSENDPNVRIKFTDYDEQIYREFRKLFPTFNLKFLPDPESGGAEKWAKLIKKFPQLGSGGRMIRVDCTKGYTKENTTIVTDIVFIAIEAARAREIGISHK